MHVICTRWLTGLALGSVLTLTAPLSVFAEEQSLTVQGGQAMRENLQKKVGTKVILQLSGGQEVSGKVVDVGETVVHISELTGKEFYDAVVRLDHISALVLRVREK